MTDTLDVATSLPSDALDILEPGTAPVPAIPQVLAAPPQDEVATAVASLGAKMRYAEMIVRSSLVPKSLTHGSGRNPEPLPIEQAVANVMVVMEYGQLLNLHPMVALSEINVMDGKPGCSGKLMRAKLREAGHKLRIHENSRQRADISIRLTDDPESEKTHFTFDLNDAVRAGLCELGMDGEARSRARWDANKVLVWEAYTDAMLFERAMAKAIRALCPEVMMGVSYTIEELESMTRDVEPPPALREPVWPHDYANDTKLRDTRTAKGALLDLCGGDKTKAAKAWEEGEFDTRPAHLLVLGHLRHFLGLPAPDGDASTTPPLPDVEDADVKAGQDDGPPDKDRLAAWLLVYEKLAQPALLGEAGSAKFQEWGKANGKKSNARTASELDEVVGKAVELYREVHGGPHKWDPDELSSVEVALATLLEDQRSWSDFEGFALGHLANADSPSEWTTGQRDMFVPWLRIGEKEAA